MSAAMQMFLVSLLYFAIQVWSIPIEDFYPFGNNTGDRDFPKNDDGSSPEVPISTLFPFFNNQHDSLIVNTNGVISFLGTLSQFTPDPFPLQNDRRLVAPFWADVDIRKGGTVWYRETFEPSILQRATDDIRTYYPSQTNFFASWVFVATWDNVAFYGASSTGKIKRNDFQAVLITNGRHSFTIFNYYRIIWTTGTASGGAASTGLGGTPAQVGFNAGDGVNYYAVNGSRTSDIINLPTISNVGVDGKFVFRIDTEIIEEGGCNTEGTLTVSPRYTNMFGGEEKILSGPCIGENDTVTVMYHSDDIQCICTFRNKFSVSCVTPTFYVTGDVTVTLTVNSAEFPDSYRTYEGEITILNPMETSQVLHRLSPEQWIRKEMVTVTWQAEQIPFNIDEAAIELYIVEPDVDNIPKIHHHSTISEYVEVTQKEFTFPLELDQEIGIIGLVEAAGHTRSPRRAVWTDMFIVIPRNSNESSGTCRKWQLQDDQFQDISDVQVQICPCTLDQIEIDLVRFHSDPSCHSFANSQQDPGISTNCLYQPHASQCFRLNSPGVNGMGQWCCYDSMRNLMNVMTSSGGGSVQRYHYLGGTNANIPYLSNFLYDVSPYYHCCVFPSGNQTIPEDCVQFYRRRKPGDCRLYVPVRPARNFGDPHFTTLDGVSYTFNPVGEFTLLRTSNRNFTAQIRTEKFERNDGSGPLGSVITAFVAKALDTSDTVEIRLNSIRVFDVLINGHIRNIPGSLSLRCHGVTIITSKNSTSTDGSKDQVKFVFPEQDVAFQVLAYKTFLNVFVLVGPKVEKGTVEGLLGNFNDNPDDDLISLDGSILSANSSMRDIHYKMGETWRIIQNETLFTYPIGTTYDSLQDTSFTPMFDIPESAINNVTLPVCGNDTFCYLDLYVTGDNDIATASRTVSQMYERMSDASQKVVSCGFPPEIENGQWRTGGLKVGDTALLICNPDSETEGLGLLTCKTNGQWSDDRSYCFRIGTTDGTGIVAISPTLFSDKNVMIIAIGVLTVVFLTIVITVGIVLVKCFCRKKKLSDLPSQRRNAAKAYFDNSAYQSPLY